MAAGDGIRRRFRRGSGSVGLGVLIVGLGVVGLVALVGLFHGLTKTSGGEVAVVRNGGPFDNHRTRQVIDPASAITWTGWWSQIHTPSSPRNLRVPNLSSNWRSAAWSSVSWK